MSPKFLLPSYERVKGFPQLIPPYDPSSHPSSLIGVMGLRTVRWGGILTQDLQLQWVTGMRPLLGDNLVIAVTPEHPPLAWCHGPHREQGLA